MEQCTQSTGAIVAWVNLASVSASADTLFYVSYDDSSIASAQNTGSLSPANVWDSNFVEVFHLGNGTTLNANGSTSNATTGTVVGTVTAASGKIDGGALMGSSGNNNYIESAGNLSYFNITGSVTLETWVYPAASSYGPGLISGFLQPGDADRPYAMFLGSTTQVYLSISHTGSCGYTAQDGFVTLSSGWTQNAWNHFVLDVVGGSSYTIYLNGSSVASASGNYGACASGPTTDRLMIGSTDSFAAAGATFDEVRVSNTNRPAGYVTAQYNQTKPSSTFLTVGSEI